MDQLLDARHHVLPFLVDILWAQEPAEALHHHVADRPVLLVPRARPHSSPSRDVGGAEVCMAASRLPDLDGVPLHLEDVLRSWMYTQPLGRAALHLQPLRLV